jgi:hypothetical protein
MKQFAKHDAYIEDLLSQKLKLTKIYRKLQNIDNSITAEYITLYRYAKKRFNLGKNRSTIRMPDSLPGESAEVDFGKLGYIYDKASGKKQLVHALVITLQYSRHQYVHVTRGQKVSDVIEGIEAAFHYFEGVPQKLVVDNMKTAVITTDAYEPVFNRSFSEYSLYRGFLIDACRPGEPQDKPKVERQIQYVRNDFFRGEKFTSLEQAREKAVEWCSKTAGLRVHGTTRKQPIIFFEAEEKSSLLPLEKARYNPPEWKEATVHPDHHIQFNKALYSTPTEYIGKRVWVRGDAGLVRVYYKEECIKTHPVKQPGERSTDINDYPKEKQGYAMKNCEHYISMAEAAGEDIHALMKELLSGVTPWAYLRQAQKLMRLIEKYGPQRVNAACRRARAFNITNVKKVEDIIKESFRQVSLDDYISGKVIKTARFAKPKEYFINKGGNSADNS